MIFFKKHKNEKPLEAGYTTYSVMPGPDEYKIVMGGYSELQEKVNKLSAEGWIVQGGVAAVHMSGNDCDGEPETWNEFAQAMIRQTQVTKITHHEAP